jgi:hypothetical protein
MIDSRGTRFPWGGVEGLVAKWRGLPPIGHVTADFLQIVESLSGLAMVEAPLGCGGLAPRCPPRGALSNKSPCGTVHDSPAKGLSTGHIPSACGPVARGLAAPAPPPRDHLPRGSKGTSGPHMSRPPLLLGRWETGMHEDVQLVPPPCVERKKRRRQKFSCGLALDWLHRRRRLVGLRLSPV